MTIRNTLTVAVSIASLGLAGCLESGGQTDSNRDPEYRIEGSSVVRGTHPLFDPLETEFVIPSDALFGLSEIRDGTMLNGTDPANPVTQGIGYLDGASVLAPIDIKLSASLDAQQSLDARDFVEIDGRVVPNPDQNVFLTPVTYAGGDALQPVTGEAPGLVAAAQYREALRLEATGDPDDAAAAEAIFEALLRPKVRVELLDIDGGTNNLIRVLPLEPLAEKTQYVLAVTNNIVDAEGSPLVGSPTYQSVADPNKTLSNPAFGPFREAMLPARRLAAAFFDFKREVEESSDFPAQFEDVVYATTITTTAVDDVLLANAAPVTFFETTLAVAHRQQGLSNLFSGFYNLSGQALAEGASAEEQAANSGIYATLTDPQFGLYDAELAAILTDANGTDTVVQYADVVTDPWTDRRLAHAIQVATAEAVEAAFAASIASEAQALADAAEPLLDTPKPRPVSVFSQKEGGDVNEALAQGNDVAPINIRVYEGEITLPYYQQIPSEGDGAVLKQSTWLAADFASDDSLSDAPSDRVSYRFPFARKVGDTTVPIVIAAPEETSVPPSPAGFPVIIYQHAVTTDRSAILPLATAAGLTCISSPEDDCFVTVGIDLPLHGIFDSGVVGLSPITDQDGASAEATERHFGFAADADLNAATAAELTEPESGSLFLNFANYANTRDNMRQSTLDLLNVNASLANIEAAINACGSCPSTLQIDTSRVYFLTHSLSGMGGAAFPHINNAAITAGNSNLNPILASNFLNTGGGFTRLVENSQSVAPRVLPGLAEASDGILVQGRTELDIYFNVFQGLLDSVDPTAYAPFYRDQPVLLTEIKGVDGDPDRPTDNTVPNAADSGEFTDYDLAPLSTTLPETGFDIAGENMPLAGTEPLARAMNAGSTPLDTDGLPYLTKYNEGAHGNPISAGTKEAEAYSSSAVFAEMTAQMLELFTDGTVSVSNPCVVVDATVPDGTDCSTAENSDPGESSDAGGDDGGDNGGLPLPI